jgi:magnesium transporter
VITILCSENGRTQQHDRIDPAWLRPDSGVFLWVDISAPSADEGQMLRAVFGFHELAIEDALSERHHPKIETYDGYLYVILHGIDFLAEQHFFATHDTDFFIGPHYLVTVHDGKTRSIPEVLTVCAKVPHVLREGPVALTHRIVDKMVDHYWPEVEKFRQELDGLEERVFDRPEPQLVRSILGMRHDVGSLRRVVLPQRDVVGRLARREFSLVSEALGYRFRDVYDHLVRLTDEAMYLQDRVVGLLDAHLSSSSNQLNRVMKVLTLIATVFMPLTVLTGLYGMNVDLPAFPGGRPAQFWWIMGMMLTITGSMMWFFKTRKWL